MPQSKVLKSYTICNRQLEIFVPAAQSLLQNIHPPYWAKVWPAALGLCNFLQNNLHYIHNKKVSELAAGLGLCSIFAAHHAAKVYCSDIEPTAVDLVKKSVQLNTLNNVHCAVADWNDYAGAIIPDTILMSDVNYEPVQFEQLLAVILFYLNHHCTVIISTPQRLMAKPFIIQLLPFCIKQEEVVITENNTETAVSIFVLRR